MKSILLQVAALLSFLSYSDAKFAKNQTLSPVPAARKGNGVVTVPVRRKHTSHHDPGASKRQIGTGLINPLYGLSYYVNISIGTPPQPVVVVLDTGSNELWVNADCSTALSAAQTAWCHSNPIYDPSVSSTAIDELVAFDLQYGKGFATGEYLKDTAWVNGVQVPNTIFGDATASNSMAAGIWGVCFAYPLNTVYYGLLDLMYLNGNINSRAFSLDLMGVDTAQGAIIFGGIDTKKYIGPLVKRPIIPASLTPDGASRYWIYMSSFGVTRSGVSHTLSSSTYNQAVYLDSGTTLTYLPTNIVTLLISYFPEAVAASSGTEWLVPCSLRNEAATINFGFGTTTIKVLLHEAIWQPTPTSTSCIFGIGASDSNWVLGDTMLRGAYVVYDQDNSNLLLAQAANCGTNIIPIGSGVDAVPSSTGQCTATTATSSTLISSSSTSLKPTSSTSSKVTLTSTSSSSRISGSSSSSSSKSSSVSSSSSVKSTSTSSSLSSSKSSSVSSTSSVKPTSTSSSLSSSKSSSIPTSSSTKPTSTSSSLVSSKSIPSSSTSSIVSSTSSKPSSTSSVLSTSSSKVASASVPVLAASSATVTVTIVSTTTLKIKTTTITLSTATVTSISTKKTVTLSATGTCTAIGQVY